MTDAAPLLLMAMKEEARALAKEGRLGSSQGLKIVGLEHDFLLSGPGSVSVIAALSGRSPSAILQVGFAGALSAEMAVGDCFKITSVRSGSELRRLENDPRYNALSPLPPARLVTAPVPMTATDKAKMQRDDAGDLVDMESFHVVEFCRAQGIPYTGIRVVSDRLEDELPEVVLRAFDGERFRLGGIISAFCFDSKARRELLALRRNAAQCSAILARYLLA